MLKKENGVTLVALVITIIVLLILAAVTLIGVMGEDGIFSKARNAKLATELSNAKDAVSRALVEVQAAQYNEYGELIPPDDDEYVDIRTESALMGSLNTQMEKDSEKYRLSGTSGTFEIKKDGDNVYDANGEKLEVKIWDTTNKHATIEFSHDAVKKDETPASPASGT